MPDTPALLHGTHDLLISKAVSLGRLDGYGVLPRIEQISRGALPIQQGALYPALDRLEHLGLPERMGRLGKQSPRQILPAHRQRPAATRRRGCEQGSFGRCHCCGAADHPTGELR